MGHYNARVAKDSWKFLVTTRFRNFESARVPWYFDFPLEFPVAGYAKLVKQ